MIVIDAGHGGNDPGTSGNGLIEKDYALKMSIYMAERFRELGIPVTLTRTTDETLSPDERVDRILKAYGNGENVIVISNHLNAGGGNGAEVIYALRNEDTLSKLILEELGKTGIPTRKVYQRENSIGSDYYFIHRETANTQPVIVEYGFVDNANNAKFIEANYKEMVDAVVKAVLMYLGTELDNTYIVQSGDTLYSIAKENNTTVQELKKLNNLTSDIITVGTVLNIKDNNMPPTLEYTVKPGDTLYSIARKFGTSVLEIKKINNLTSDFLSVNDQLKIPKNESIETYTVKQGDTLYSIARENNTTVNTLIRINNLTSTVLSIGQVLRIK